MKSKILGARDTADLISGSEMLTMALLQTFISGTQNRPSLAVFQSSAAQTTIPVLRQFLATSLSSKGGTPRHRIVFCLLYLPSSLIESTTFSEIEVHDWLDNVPGYSPEYFKVGPQLLSTLDQGKRMCSDGSGEQKLTNDILSFECAFWPPRCDSRLNRHIAIGRRISFRNL